MNDDECVVVVPHDENAYAHEDDKKVDHKKERLGVGARHGEHAYERPEESHIIVILFLLCHHTPTRRENAEEQEEEQQFAQKDNSETANPASRE